MSKLGTILALGVVCSLGRAEESDYTARLGIVQTQGDLRTITRTPIGFAVELGYDIHKPATNNGIGLALYGSFINIKGKDTTLQTTANAKGTSAGVDVVHTLGSTPLSIKGGLLLSSWDITRLRAVMPDTGAEPDNTWKLGFRIGAEYKFTPRWSMSVVYTQSSWTSRTADNYQAHPSWVSVMAGYRF